MAILNGTVSYMPPSSLQTFENDLSLLPSLVAAENDIVITNKKISNSFIDTLALLKIENIIYKSQKQVQAMESSHFNWIRPWCWSPVAHNTFKNTKKYCSDSFKESPNNNWNDSYKLFFSRNTSLMLTTKLFNNTKLCEHIEIPIIPKRAISLNEIDNYSSSFNQKYVIKAPWSSSGRGILMVDSTKQKPLNINWVKGILKQQGFVTIEPLYNKIADVSFQFVITETGMAVYIGHIFFINDNSGHFTGSHIEPYPLNIIKRINKTWLKSALEEAQKHLTESLSQMNLNHYYVGPVGVDAILFMNKKEKIKIHPCIEINLRYTMGTYTLSLRSNIHPHSNAIWGIERLNKQTPNVNDLILKPLKTSDGLISNCHIFLTDNPDQFRVWLTINDC